MDVFPVAYFPYQRTNLVTPVTKIKNEKSGDTWNRLFSPDDQN